MTPIFDTLTAIAERHLDIPTLKERHSDNLDFHEVSVWGVKDALWYAYQAGASAAAEATRATTATPKTLVELTEGEFNERYPLLVNHLDTDAGWCIGDSPGRLFTTYGEELEFIRRQDPRTVWTLIDGENGDQHLTSGFHIVNRIGYLISTHAVPEGTDIHVHIPFEPDPEPDSGESLIHAPWSLRFERDGTEDVAVISDAQGDELLRSRPFWLPLAGDPVPVTLAALRLVAVAPQLLEFARQVVRAKDREESVPLDIYHAAVRLVAQAEPEGEIA